MELIKYRTLIMATLDYCINNEMFNAYGNVASELEHLKSEAQQHFEKGRLAKLKQWFRDLAEPHIETLSFDFDRYLKEATNFEIDVFQQFYQRINKIVEKGKITTDRQFYETGIMVDHLSQSASADQGRISVLNNLLKAYEKSKSKKIDNPR